MSWYLGQFWWLLLLSFALGFLVGYWWWRRQFRRTQVSSSSSTQGSCGHGTLLAEKDAEIARLRAGAADSGEVAPVAADLAEGAGDQDGHGLLDRIGDAAHDAKDGIAGDAGAAVAAAGGLVDSVRDRLDGDDDSADAPEVSDDSGDVAAEGENADADAAGVLDDAEATTRVHLAGDGAGLAPEVSAADVAVNDGAMNDGAAVDGAAVDGAAADSAVNDGAAAEGAGIAAALADAAPDDLERVEGIGPRIAGALKAAGIHTFRALSDADVATLQSALEAGGLRFAPSLPTWARQARLLADGDEAGFKALTDRLVAGRDTGSNG